ncbi:MAG: histidine--tRNA ligase [Candidatus Paceibacterota bacterium]|jgi:histidyl-tRNA synthetase
MPINIPRAPKKKEVVQKIRVGKKFVSQSAKGMHDVLPADFAYIERFEKILKKVAAFYGFERIESPIAEDIKLFERGTGLTSEIVQKQMFMVKSQGGEGVLALRPEFTPGVARAYIESGLVHTMLPAKFYYEGAVFRHEQPQHGRFRQLHQIGFEIFGSDDPAYDAQVVMGIYKLFDESKLKNVVIKINSIGCKNCRPVYVKKLKEYYKDKQGKLCRDCAKRYGDNPLRLLDCKEEKCALLKADAPQVLDYLCVPCKRHFTAVLEYLDATQVPYLIDQTLVRGLDYYTRTVFELFAEGFDGALAGGGRYDYLFETLGGPKLASVGAALGVERAVMALKAQNVPSLARSGAKALLIYMGDEAKKKAFVLLEEFYHAGIVVHEAFSRDSLKSQLRVADKEGVALALILGQREVFEEVIIVRDMKSGTQETVPLKRVVDEVKKRI